MRAAERGLCMDLLPEVLDKYFFAEPVGERFQRQVGRTICANCPIRPACLEEAIVEPPGWGIRGGESTGSLWRLHGRWMKEHVEADVLAAEAIRRQTGRLSLQQAARAQKGKFPDVPLAFPELGGLA